VVKKPRRVRSIIGASAVLAVAAGAVAFQLGTANADEPGASAPVSVQSRSLLDGVKQFKGLKTLTAKDVPPGAHKATKLPETPGKKGATFAKPGVHTNITGGTTANAADFPSVVGIQAYFLLDDGTGTGGTELWVSTCTGSVLSPTRILTAGHCNVDLPYGSIDVIAGRNTLSDTTTGFVARVANAWTNPGFNYPAINDPSGPAPVDDVSVLTLKDPLPSAYTPVTLADQGAADPAEDTSATIVGYGSTERGATDSGVLRTATVPIKSDETCAAAWPGDFNGTTMMCAGTIPTTSTCSGDSGGPIFTGAADARVQVGITDWGANSCAANYSVYSAINHYSNVIKQQITLQAANNLDFTGDGHSDLFGRIPGSGELVVATGAGFQNSSFTGFSDIFGGSGPYFYASTSNFSKFTKLFRVNNWGGDKTESVFARDSSGRLFNYRTNGYGDFLGGAPLQIGSGWNMFNEIMGTNDWIGNGLPNLIGRKPNGELWLYNSNGSGGWLNPRGTRIGSGWGVFNTILTPGSWLGDGHQSLIGRKANGELWLYNSNGSGGWTNPSGTRIGTGWNIFPKFLSIGDWNGDNLVDLFGITTSGQLRLYTTNGKGAWLNSKGPVIDTGWNGYDMIF
jgi:hypothetical protein